MTVTTKEMKRLVATAQSYERSMLWLEKVTKLEAHIKEMEALGIEDEWVREQTEQLRLQRARMQHLRISGKLAHERLEQIMGEITNDYIYQILSRHFLLGQTWGQIAVAIGGGNSADGVRKTAVRYLAAIQI